jgi:hypothetical protein
MQQAFRFPSPQRSPVLQTAIEEMATTGETDRGAIYTRGPVVDLILDLAGYRESQPLATLRLLEPSTGEGDFLIPAVRRLLRSWRQTATVESDVVAELGGCILAVELSPQSLQTCRASLIEVIREHGVGQPEAEVLAQRWLHCDDFLLAAIEGEFDVVVGNPPYVRQERVPNPLLKEYRRRFKTVYDRADLYVPFYERGLRLLAPGGRLGFICANRWLKNKYGGPLRDLVHQSFHLEHFIDMVGTDAFHSEVIAYPAITVIRRPVDPAAKGPPTRIASRPKVDKPTLAQLSQQMLAEELNGHSTVRVATEVTRGRDPWLLDNPAALGLVRRLEARFPTLEAAGAKVGIGVATGADRVFIGPYDDLDVEPERKLPLAMGRDLVNLEIQWKGKGVVNPFLESGALAAPEDFPRFAAFLEANEPALRRRHVAKKNPNRWYRTIDRIYPSLVDREKLLIPDIKGTATVVYDKGDYYPHHNLYVVTSDTWELRALQAVLRSSIAVLFVSAYCVRMAGGFLRFQAQYLRRIRVPVWEDLPESLQRQLTEHGAVSDLTSLNRVVGLAYGLADEDLALAAQVAEAAQVRPKKKRKTQNAHVAPKDL